MSEAGPEEPQRRPGWPAFEPLLAGAVWVSPADSGGMRVLSQAEMQEQYIRWADGMRNAKPSLFQILGMANHQPPIDKASLDARYAKFCADLAAFTTKFKSAPAA